MREEEDSLNGKVRSWRDERERAEKKRGEEEQLYVRFVGCVDASGIIYGVRRQYVSQITIESLLSAIKNTSSTFIRQINLLNRWNAAPLSSLGSSLGLLLSSLILACLRWKTNDHVALTQ